MGRLTNRIGRGLAVAMAVAIPLIGLQAAPAQAADHFTVDRDGVVLGANSSNSYRAFDGSMESWHDGDHVRATLRGTFVGRGYLRITWIFHDGSKNTDDVIYTDGVQKDVAFGSGAGRDVVRALFTYEPNSGSTETVERYVGDAPESAGSCVLLDTDAYEIAASGVSFSGTTTYHCDASGQIYARIRGTLSGPSTGDWGTAALKAAPTFAQGDPSSPVTITTVSSNGPRSTDVDVTTTTAKDVRTVKLIVSHGTESSQTKSFGDG
jgi:hypothetical protein